MKKSSRMTFVKESGFIFAMIGSAVGFANILSFSAQCYKNGGGAFLIPFLVANLVIGLPMLFLEGIIGKKYGLPISSAYGKVLSNNWKIFGWIAALSCLTIGSFYSVITAWSVAYTYFAATNSIPADTALFFKQEFLKDSGSILSFGSLSLSILISAIAVAIFSWYIVSRDISKGVEKICAWLMPVLGIILVVFSIIVVFLPGATDGFYYYLKPDFSKLKDFRLWRDVFGHVFFSLSLGIGIVVGYSRHTKEETNIKRAMTYVVVADVLVGLIAGFAIFGCVGFLSHQTGIEFKDIVKSDSTFQMGWVIFPEILNIFSPWVRPIIGSIFFFCLFIAGITGVFSIIEAVSGNIETEFRISRKKSVTITSSLMFLFSIFFCMGNAVHILGAIAPMVLGYVFLVGGMAQIYVFMFIDKSVANDKIWHNSKGKHGLVYFTAKYIGFAFLAMSLIGSLYQECQETFSAAHIVRWSWLLIILGLAIIASRKIHQGHKY